MSSDLVKRLRDGNTLDIGEAADRIEALEGELAKSKADYQAMKAWADELYAKNSAAETRAERLREALQGLHDDVDDYQRINNLSGHNNHWMVIARKALEDDKQ